MLVHRTASLRCCSGARRLTFFYFYLFLFLFLFIFYKTFFSTFSFGVVIALSRCNRDTLTVARQRTMVPEPSGWPTSTLLSFPRAIELGGS